MSAIDPPYKPRARASRTTEQVVWRLEETADGCVSLRAVPWWHLRAYLNFAVIMSAITALCFVGFWWWGITTTPIPWWWVAIAVFFAAYWPIDRAFVQARARLRFPILLRPSKREIEIEGDLFPTKAVEAIEHLRVRYGDPGGELGPIHYHEIHAIVGSDSGRRRIVIVEEAMNGATYAAELARLIGCEARSVEVAGPK